MQRKSTFLYLLVFFLTACSGNSRVETVDVKTTVMGVLTRQVEDWNRGSVKDFMAGYWQNDSLKFVSGGSVTYGWQETLDRYLNRYDTAEKMGQLTFDDVHIRVLGRDTAIADGRWALGYPDRPGSEGRFTLLFQRIGGQWRIVYDHTSLKQAV